MRYHNETICVNQKPDGMAMQRYHDEMARVPLLRDPTDLAASIVIRKKLEPLIERWKTSAPHRSHAKLAAAAGIQKSNFSEAWNYKRLLGTVPISRLAHVLGCDPKDIQPTWTEILDAAKEAIAMLNKERKAPAGKPSVTPTPSHSR